MIEFSLMTAEEFVDRRLDWDDIRPWSELVKGHVKSFEQPDEAHGLTLLNFSKALGQYLMQLETGYACFDMGLVTARDPDTVRFTPCCIFSAGPRFAEMDKPVTDSVPQAALEVASTSDRRNSMRERVLEYLDWGIEVVWVADPQAEMVHTFRPGQPIDMLNRDSILTGGETLAGFEVPVGELFVSSKH